MFVTAATSYWLMAPTERIGSLEFRLMFDGAAQGRYQNNTPFSPTEIVATPVVTAVFNANDLQRFGDYQSFKNTLFIQQSNAELQSLSAEYQAKLEDSRLTSVDRSRLESKFAAKRGSIVDPNLSLSFRRTERFTRLPQALAQKLLTEMVNGWAEYAAVRKGALRYEVGILSTKILSRESLKTEDYLVSANLLRSQATRIINTIERIQLLPGATNFRTAEESESLAEIRAGLEDTVRFELEPVMGIIQSEGITKDARLLALYLSSMMFQIRLEREETNARALALQRALGDYVAQAAGRPRFEGSDSQTAASRANEKESSGFAPQLSESFLARLEGMSVLARDGELAYRRKLTDQIIDETRRLATLDRQV